MGHKGLSLTLNLSLKEIKAASKLSAFPNKTGDSTTSRFSDKQWNRGLKKLKYSSLKVSRTQLDKPLKNLVRTQHWSCFEREVGQITWDYIPKFPSNLSYSVIRYCIALIELTHPVLHFSPGTTSAEEQKCKAKSDKQDITSTKWQRRNVSWKRGVDICKVLVVTVLFCLDRYKDYESQKIKNHQVQQQVARRNCSIPVLEGLRVDWIKPWAAQADLGDGPALSTRLDCRPSEVLSNLKHPKILWKISRVRVLEYISLQDEILQNTELAGTMPSHTFFSLNFYYSLSCLHIWERFLVKSPDSLSQCQHMRASINSSPMLSTLHFMAVPTL